MSPSSFARFALATTLSAGAFSGASAWGQPVIDTTPAWDGSDYVSYFGENATRSYGQTFVAPTGATTLDAFTFYLGDNETPGDFGAYLMEWSGNRPTGTVLFQTGPITTTGPSIEAYRISTGGIALTAGVSYVAFFSEIGYLTGSGSYMRWGQVPDSTYAQGTFVYLHSLTSDPISEDWTTYHGIDLAFLFEFSDGASPESQGNPASGPGAAPGKLAPILLVDQGAIQSTLTTGLMMPLAHRSAMQNLTSTALGDLNARLFRARSGEGGGDQGGVASGDTSSSFSNYLAFASGNLVDYRVALGLAEGREVSVHDTLAQGLVRVGSPTALVGGMVALAAAADAKAVVADGAGPGYGKEVVDAKAVVSTPVRNWEVYTAFDYGYYGQDTLTSTLRGFDTDNYAGTLGVEYRLLANVNVGVAWSHLWSDTESEANLGGIDIEGQLFSGYVTAFWRGFYADALYAYGSFDNEISRNTLLGRRAFGDTDSYSHNFAFNVGHNWTLAKPRIVTGPWARLDYSTGGIGGYTETGGGSANLIYPDDNYESMPGRVGWQVSHGHDLGHGLKLTAQGRAGWGHEFMPETDSVSASLATSPFLLISGNSARRLGGYTAEAEGAHAGQDWLILGAGLRLEHACGVSLSLDYEGMFGRDDASAHFGSVKLGYAF